MRYFCCTCALEKVNDKILCICILHVAHICSNQIMGWGEKAIEIRSVETGHLDGVFMHKRAQRLKFLCERNDKVINFHTRTHTHTHTHGTSHKWGFLFLVKIEVDTRMYT